MKQEEYKQKSDRVRICAKLRPRIVNQSGQLFLCANCIKFEIGVSLKAFILTKRKKILF